MDIEPRSWQPAMTGCNHMIWIGDEEGNCMECEAVLIWVVPDTRLQAIADAPRCEHDRIDKHDYQGKVEGGWHTMACLGAPRLRALLKALTTEEARR